MQTTDPAYTQNIDQWIAHREEFREKVAAIMEEGRDYYIIHGRKSLSKGGAEKIASLFKWSASFDKDSDVLSILDQTTDKYVALICNLYQGSDRLLVGQGRGAASLKANHGDVNKWIKMAQKSAFIDAVLRASGLSDSYTQDLEDMNPEHIGNAQDNIPFAPYPKEQLDSITVRPDRSGPIKPSQKQMETIMQSMERKNILPEDLIAAGLPPLKDLTGGREGTASQVIDWLFKQKKMEFRETPTQQKAPKPEPYEVDVSDIPF